MPLTRREFLRSGSMGAAHVVVGSSLFALGCDLSYYGPLGPPDANGIRLPPGFASRVVARTGEVVAPSSHVWHGWPDGGAVFEDGDGWIYVSNAELLVGGGVSALRFDAFGEIVDAYPICSGTRRNCSGGATPWGTWLSCEEVATGIVYECDPTGSTPKYSLPRLGRFNHEAVAVDPDDRRLYLTEDRIDGRLYRFTPNAWANLTGGLLEVLEVDTLGDVFWHEVPDPIAWFIPTRHQVAISTAFKGGEGIVYSAGHVYFATKGDNRIWDLDVAEQTLAIHYDRAQDPTQQLGGVDNVGVTPTGHVLVAEDGGNMELVMLDEHGQARPLLRVEGQSNSELAGPAFDPSGTRLYFSSQRGTNGRGITYEVIGPFAELRAPARERLTGANEV